MGISLVLVKVFFWPSGHKFGAGEGRSRGSRHKFGAGEGKIRVSQA